MRRSLLSKAGVLAAAAYLHYVGFLSLFAIFAAVLAVLLARAITSWMSARGFTLFWHGRTSFLKRMGSPYDDLLIMLSRANEEVKLRKCRSTQFPYCLNAANGAPLIGTP
jgi:preprotein translocase subunit SecD